MRACTCRIVGRTGAVPGIVLLGLLTGGAAWADDDSSTDAGPADSPKPISLQSQSAARKPLNFTLTQAELRSIISEYEARTGEILTAPILEDEVLVTAPGVAVPMRERTQEVWGGIAAPFWAIRNPTQAWRILVPIPPKGEPKEVEPPVPDPR